MNIERLKKLADHLRNGKLGHAKFDFSTLNGHVVNTTTGCGTNGCAIGECPILFPEEWEFRKEETFTSAYWPRLIRPMHGNADGSKSFRDAEAFFGLTQAESNLLFIPADTEQELQNGQLSEDATRYDVAEQIEKFIAGTIYA